MKRVMCLFCCFLCIVLLSSCSDEEYDSVKATYADYGYHHDTDYRITELEEKIEHLEDIIWQLTETQEECLQDLDAVREAEGATLCSVAEHYGIDEDEFFDVYLSYYSEESGNDLGELIKYYEDSFDEVLKTK